jgi:hypothetical protein
LKGRQGKWTFEKVARLALIWVLGRQVVKIGSEWNWLRIIGFHYRVLKLLVLVPWY